ncbi:STAS domain-containing protein [Streptomyces sp. NPDC002990]
MGEIALVTVRGEIDLRAEPALARVLRTLPGGASLVVLDMRQVPFMDAAGLHFYLALHRLTERHGTRLLSVHWQPQPRRLLDIVARTAGRTPGRPADLDFAARAFRRELGKRARLLQALGV